MEALAQRPGRIDQAVDVPVPDSDCRRRLFELYGRGLDVVVAVDPYVARTAGASAAFMRELLRKAALFAADDDGHSWLEARQFDEALHEMVVEGGDRSLLGGAVRTGNDRRSVLRAGGAGQRTLGACLNVIGANGSHGAETKLLPGSIRIS